MLLWRKSSIILAVASLVGLAGAPSDSRAGVIVTQRTSDARVWARVCDHFYVKSSTTDSLAFAATHADAHGCADGEASGSIQYSDSLSFSGPGHLTGVFANGSASCSATRFDEAGQWDYTTGSGDATLRLTFQVVDQPAQFEFDGTATLAAAGAASGAEVEFSIIGTSVEYISRVFIRGDSTTAPIVWHKTGELPPAYYSISITVRASAAPWDLNANIPQTASASLNGALKFVQPAGHFVVNSTGNAGDLNLNDGICDTGNLVHGLPECTLEAAITQANAKAGDDNITFSIPADDPGHNNGIYTILPIGQLSIVSTTMKVDATTQSGYLGSPVVFLDGTVSRGDIAHPNEMEGFRISSDGSEVRGLAVGNWGKEGIKVTGNNNKVGACYLGLHPDGVTGAGNITEGIWIDGGHGNVVGGGAGSDRCVVSNNGRGTAGTTGNQIEISGVGATANRIEGCYVGTNAAGTAVLPNPPIGIQLHEGCSETVVGGTVGGARNVISGHGTGVNVDHSRGNLIQGNFIGLNAAGDAALPNKGNGIDLRFSPDNVIGGIAGVVGTPPGNVISGNRKDQRQASAIYITLDSPGTRIQGNLIGTNAAGTADLGNGGYGVHVNGSDSTFVGGPVAGARNVIAANDLGGILFEEATTSAIEGNFIGLNALGNGVLPNGGSGVELRNSPGNIIGGISGPVGTPPGNVIAGNRKAQTLAHGIALTGNSNGTRIQGNFIGTDGTGLVGRGNGGDGVFVEDSDSTIVGGSVAGARNVIAANDFNGVTLDGAKFSAVQGNLIGLNHWGDAALANGGSGVELQASPDNTIGGIADVAGAPPGNVISGNRRAGAVVHGVHVDDLSPRNTIQGNFIGLDEAGAEDLGNGGHGILLAGADSTLVGALDERGRNVISGNDSSGVYIRGGAGTRLYENLVGPNAANTAEFENGLDGVTVEGSSDNEFYENLFRGNHRNGFRVRSGERNRLERNRFFANEGLGIDLEPGGVTFNDLGDPDEGANQLQNFPFLQRAQEVADSNLVTVRGSLSGNPSTDYRLDFFANTVCDPSGNGEGKELWEEDLAIRTNNSGFADFELSLSLVLIGGRPDYVSATATDAEGNTSEFSNCLRVLPPPLPPPGQAVPFVVNTTRDLPDLDPGDNLCSTGEMIAGGTWECTLRAAIEETNALVGAQTVLFQIPDETEPVIRPQTPLPAMTGPLELNAQTQSGFNGSPIVTLDGSDAGATAGLVLNGTGVEVRGLVIEGFSGDGVQLEGTGFHTVEGNKIDAVSGHGVVISSGGNRVGHSGQMQGNGIVGNEGDGIRVVSGEGNALLNNGLRRNGGLGINLAGGTEDSWGATANDANDGDGGPNGLQNTPQLTSARIFDTLILVEGTLESAPHTDYQIAFYAADSCDASGSGEGEIHLGSVDVTTNGSGSVQFSVQLSLELSGSTVQDLETTFVTATAMDGANNTSEFSPCRGSVVPVVLLFFEAVAVSDGVRVSWAVSDESDHVGFHLYRREPGEDWTRVSETMLKGGPTFEYVDRAVNRERDYEYLLEGLSRTGALRRFGPVPVQGQVAPEFALRMAGNPVVGAGRVLVGLPEATRLSLQVFDVQGRLVRILGEGLYAAGEHDIAWNGRDEASRPVPAGNYWIQLRAPGVTRTTRVTLLR